MTRPTWQERLWASAAPDANGCWVWQKRSIDNYGYASFKGPKSILGPSGRSRAHRWAHVAAIGPIPEGLEVDHLCNVRLCINPDHLEAVTPQENKNRRSARQTHCKWGHEYTPENTYRCPGTGWRKCRKCSAESCIRHRARKSVAA